MFKYIYTDVCLDIRVYNINIYIYIYICVCIDQCNMCIYVIACPSIHPSIYPQYLSIYIYIHIYHYHYYFLKQILYIYISIIYVKCYIYIYLYPSWGFEPKKKHQVGGESSRRAWKVSS